MAIHLLFLINIFNVIQVFKSIVYKNYFAIIKVINLFFLYLVMDKFFNAESIVVIGASREEKKVGNVILKNLVNNYNGKLYAVNPNACEILGVKCYPSVSQIKDSIDLAVIAVQAAMAPRIIKECGKKKIRNIIIISSGFKEVGNYNLEKELIKALNKHGIKAIGTNCLGIYDSSSRIDTLFLPYDKLKRPRIGGISFVCQSGAVGSTILDLAAEEGLGVSKFISYGNATDIDESDLIAYLAKDSDTKVICAYIEGVVDGKKFLHTIKETAKIKPLVIIKGGTTAGGAKAALSHTGSLAGSAEVYFGAFKQAHAIKADHFKDIFNFLKIFEKCSKPNGNEVQIITNGGGFGILCADYVAEYGLSLANLDKKTKKLLKNKLPKIIVINNPLDLAGDATDERYKIALETLVDDKNVDIILVVLLYQTPLLTENVADILIDSLTKKPIVVISTGSSLTSNIRKKLEDGGLAVYQYPEDAVKSIRALVEYNSH